MELISARTPFVVMVLSSIQSRVRDDKAGAWAKVVSPRSLIKFDFNGSRCKFSNAEDCAINLTPTSEMRLNPERSREVNWDRYGDEARISRW